MGGVGVSIFLIISGFGINESYKAKGFDRFWLKKLLRVFFPYILLEVILLGLGAMDEEYESDKLELILDILCLRTRLWFVSFILYMYVAFYVFTRWFYKYRLLLLIITGIVILLFMRRMEGEQGFSFVTGVAISEYKDAVIPWLSRHSYKVSLSLFLIGIVFLAIKQLPIVRSFGESILMNCVQTLIKLPLGLAIIIVTMKADGSSIIVS